MPSGETSRVGKGDSDRLGGVAGDGGTGITGPKDSDSLIHRVTELEIVPREAKEGFESDVVELQQETVKTAVLVDALENDASVAMEDTERVHHEEGQKKRERAAWQRVDGINPFAGTLRDRGQHDELYTLSENKIVQKEQAILELKNQTPACYQYVDETDGRTVFAAANSSVCRWNDGSQHTTKLPRSSEAAIESTLGLLN